MKGPKTLPTVIGVFLLVSLAAVGISVNPVVDAASAQATSSVSIPTVTTLVEALRRGDTEAFARALRAQPDLVNQRTAGGSTPLMFAASYGDVPAIALLLERGADPNLSNDAGATALMWGVDDEDVTRLLLTHHANPNATSKQGQSALSIAAGRSGSSRIVALLIDAGASPGGPSRLGTVATASGAGDPLTRAADAGDEGVFRMLVQHGANLKAPGALGLMLAARSGCAGCVEKLLESTSQPDLNYALVALAPYGDAALLARLIDRGAEVNARVPDVRRDMRGRTPLMMAASSDRLPVDAVTLLIARGADVDAEGPEGETALDLARRNGETKVVEVLRRAGAKSGRGFAAAIVTPRPAATIRAALERVVPLLQRSDVTFVKKAGCVSCHHNTYTAMTVATLRSRALPFDGDIAREQARTIASIVSRRREGALLGSEIQNTASNLLVGLAAHDQPADFTTDAMADFVKSRQLADGRWRNFWIDHRPPIQASDVEVTAMSIRALRRYAPTPRVADYDAAVRRGTAWLLGATVNTTDERALQLLGLAWGGIDPSDERVRKAGGILIAEQRSDGGWGQLPTLGSDAYATGQALVALHESGALGAGDTAYQHGVRYLMTTQLEDGSWYVKTRSLAFQPYFESGFPHGPDQWISMAASNWAAMALALASPEPRR
jgi:ankyrin repeat protein